jgi:NADH dehydrogenase
MFGPDDAFIRTFARIARSAPAIPLIGGDTRMQPNDVSDVAEAVAACLGNPATAGKIYELGGSEVYTVRNIFEMILARMGRQRSVFSIPFAIGAVANCVEIRRASSPMR